MVYIFLNLDIYIKIQKTNNINVISNLYRLYYFK